MTRRGDMGATGNETNGDSTILQQNIGGHQINTNVSLFGQGGAEKKGTAGIHIKGGVGNHNVIGSDVKGHTFCNIM